MFRIDDNYIEQEKYSIIFNDHNNPLERIAARGRELAPHVWERYYAQF